MTDHMLHRRALVSAAGVLGLTACSAAVAAEPKWSGGRPPPVKPKKPKGRPHKTPHPTATPSPHPTASPSAEPTGGPTGGPTVGAATANATPTTGATGTTSGTGPLIGMSTPAGMWAARSAAVGPGLGARRIFADLAAGPRSQIALVEQAHADGMLPVISYKVGGDITGAANGSWNALADQAAAALASYGRPTAVTFWHEPHGDIAPEQYVAASKQLLPRFKRGELRVGPILNGWLLDNQLAVFGSYCPDDLFALWDWVGIDTYESGTASNPGPRKPATRIPTLAAYVAGRGYERRLGIGEYNGYSSASISDAGEALLSTPDVWFGCVWNSDGDRAEQLVGDRLDAFRTTLADPRVLIPR